MAVRGCGQRYDDCTQVLDDRALIAAEATSLGLTPPATLRVVFEATGDGAVEAATAEARSELATLSGINAAERENARSRELLEMIGLLFADTDASLLAAGQAFEAGQLQSADAAAESVIAERRGADFAGRLRVGAGSGVLLLAGGTGLVAIRRRRRQALTPADSSL